MTAFNHPALAGTAGPARWCRALLAPLLALLASAPLAAQTLEDWRGMQSQRPIVLDNARLLTMDGDPIPSGRLVIRAGKIEALGPRDEVSIPAGADVRDLKGATVMPGLVAAFTSAGRGRRSSAGNAAGKIGDKVQTRQKVYEALLRTGVTTLVVAPEGSGAVGLAARVDLAESQTFQKEDFIVDDDVFLVLGSSTDERRNDAFAKQLQQAKEEVEYRENPPKPEEPEKKEEGKEGKGKGAGKDKGDGKDKPESRPSPKPEGDQPEKDKPKPDGEEPEKDKPKDGEGDESGKDGKDKTPKKPERKVNPAVAKLADMLQGKQRTVLIAGSATEFAYWDATTEEYLEELLEEDKLTLSVVVRRYDSREGLPHVLTDSLKEMGGTVLLPPDVPVEPYTVYRRHVAQELHAAGIPVGFHFGDRPQEVRRLWFGLMEMVRFGLDPDVALRGVTRVPAEMLGMGKRAGRLAKGVRADLLIFDGDPLSPAGRLRQVWLAGQEVPEGPLQEENNDSGGPVGPMIIFR